MANSLKNIYSSALEKRLSAISLAGRPTSSAGLDFKKLYYCIRIDEGEYAFQSHSVRLNKAKKNRAELFSSSEIYSGFDFGHGSLLETEPLFEKSSLVLSKDKISQENPGRILAVANAGHGKTTLLNRIALYYSQKTPDDELSEDDLRVVKAYSLPCDRVLIPCIIRLRDYSEKLSGMALSLKHDSGDDKTANFLQTATCDTVLKEIRVYCERQSIPVPDLSETFMLFEDGGSNLLLLVDGLDELSRNGRKTFLVCLERCLERYPKTNIILTSRVSGLSEDGIRDLLQKMRFRGRTVMPLSLEDASDYARHWIRSTVPEERIPLMEGQLKRVLTQSRFKFVREMMTSPLDLMVMLTAMSKGPLSSNRAEMFKDILRTRFTNHVTAIREKDGVFLDIMQVLAIVCFKMQEKTVLSVSDDDIRCLTPLFNCFGYQTSVTGCGDEEDYLELFEELSVNSGIIDRSISLREDGTESVIYSIPIRSYQEYLTAYAVTKLDVSGTCGAPRPYEILSENINNSNWSRIISFAFAELSGIDGNKNELERLLTCIIEKSDDLDQLCDIIQSYSLPSEKYARLLFTSKLCGTRLDDFQRSIITACVSSMSGQYYEFALRSLYYESSDDKYLEALACISVLSMLAKNDEGLLPYIESCLSDKDEKNARLAAAMLCEAARLAISYFDEHNRAEEPIYGTVPYEKLAYECLAPQNGVCELLHDKLGGIDDYIYVEALTGLFPISRSWANVVYSYLDDIVLKISAEKTENMLVQITKLIDGEQYTPKQLEDCFTNVKELLYSLGILGFTGESSEFTRYFKESTVSAALTATVDAFYSAVPSHSNIDRLSLAYAKSLLGLDNEELLRDFTSDICTCLTAKSISECVPSDFDSSCVREARDDMYGNVWLLKDTNCCARERRFYEIVKESVEPIAFLYANSSEMHYNTNCDIEAEAYIKHYFIMSALEELQIPIDLD